MHTRLISRPNADTLLVYFAGWGTPDSVAEAFAPADADILLCSDYRHTALAFDFNRYRRIGVLAWSMGVWVAERAIQGVNVDWAVAVNGTGLPYDDQYGIPCAVFDQTLARFDVRNRAKFEQRMCADATAWRTTANLTATAATTACMKNCSFCIRPCKPTAAPIC